MTANEHGSLNRIIFLVVVALTFLVYGIVLLFIFLYKNYRKIFWTASVILVALWLMFYFIRINGSCEGWEYGLGGRKLDNSLGHCKVPIPTSCELQIRSGALAIYKFGNECENTQNTFNFNTLPEGLKERKSEIKRIGYPRVEDFATKIKVNQNTFRDHVYENYFDMDDPKVSEEIKNNTEFYIDVSNPNEHKIVFEFKPNKTRAEEQKKVYEESVRKEKEEGSYGQRIDKNMLILYIDNISRAHFYRKMPKTAEWLEKFMKDEEIENEESDEEIEKTKEDEYSIFQFFRYHGVYFNTQFSNSALWYGSIHEVKNTSTNVFDSFQRHGYMTGFFKDSCETRASEIRDETLINHRYDHFGGEIS